jgi:hypothetical protein
MSSPVRKLVRMENAGVTQRMVKASCEGRTFTAPLWEPSKLHSHPLLVIETPIAFTAAEQLVFHEYVLAHGHRIISLGGPQEGSRADSFGGELPGMNAAIAAGRDIVGEYVRDSMAVLDECIHLGLAASGRIIIAGISRGGHCAAHLMAADPRISSGGFFAPVTSLSSMTEFAESATSEAVTRLDLWHLAGKLAGRRIWLGIGSRDERVDTTATCRFYLALRQAEACPLGESRIDFFITEDEDHRFGERWYALAAQTLIGELDECCEL